MKCAIIGAGIGGLATAIRLAAKGHNVEVFEANAYAGGKLSEISENGFRFDAGPSLFTMPHFIDELFELAGFQPHDYFQYQRLPEVCRYFWEDGTRFSVKSDNEEFADVAEEELGEMSESIRSYLAESAFKYEVLSGLFLEDSLHKFSTWFSKKAFRGYANLARLGIFETLNEANEKAFKNPKTVQLFNRYATYNGSNPYETPATMGIIPHLEYNVGAFFPKGGMVAITESLVKLAEKLGVKFHFERKVDEIWVEQNKVQGVVVRGEKLRFETVVSNMDVTPTYRKLLPKEKHPEKLLKQPKSGSGVIFYWGIKNVFPELDLHNIFFSDNYKAEFEHQFQHKTIYKDPTVYLNITSKYNPEDAPEGCENWFVLINAPANEGQNWDEIIAETRKNVLDKLSRILGQDIASLVLSESILDPRSIEIRTSSSQGALYGNSSNNRFAAFLRHPNFSKNIKGLYFVGGSVHPGGGIPLALSSAKIASNMIAEGV